MKYFRNLLSKQYFSRHIHIIFVKNDGIMYECIIFIIIYNQLHAFLVDDS